MNDWIDGVPFPHVSQHKAEVCVECAVIAPASRHVHEGEWCAKCVEHGVAEEARRHAGDVQEMRDALVAAAIPLEVIRSSDIAKPFRELSPQLMAEVVAAVLAIRDALGEARK